MKADSIAFAAKDYTAQAIINNLVAATFREVADVKASHQYSIKTRDAIHKITNKSIQLRLLSDFEQEKAYLEMFNNNPQGAIMHLRQGNKYCLAIDSVIDISFQLAINNMIIGENYLKMKEIDSALVYFDNPLHYLSKSTIDPSALQGYIFNGMAQSYFAWKNKQQAETYFEKAKTIADTSKSTELKKEVYLSLSRYYKNIGNQSQHKKYHTQYLQFIEKEQKTRKTITDQYIDSITQQKQELDLDVTAEGEHKERQSIIPLFVATLMVIILLFSGYIFLEKRKRKRLQTQLAKVQNDSNNIIQRKTDSKKEGNYISKDKEQSILKSLDEIEKSQFYIDENISLNVLAGLVGVNQRYLSYVIKKHKSADFTNYINELRINHIVELLKKDADYLKYKISYLAELCGFSSHTRFTVNFKKVTGMTPSVFIAKLKKENENKKEN